MTSRSLLVVIVLLGLFLRLYRLGANPPALYWDEASLGYNAFSIATTLRDEHGVFLPLTNFAAFGDYKPPGYIYAAALSVKFLGLNEFSTRLPSALAGSLLVLTAYFLINELKLRDEKLALVGSFLVAVSPWALQMSRAAFEANLATFFSSLGAVCFLANIRKRSFLMSAVSALLFALSVYTFNAHRIFVPLFILGLFVLSILRTRTNLKQIVVFAMVFLLLTIPLIPHVASKEGRLRFNEVTWLNDLALIVESNKKITDEGGSFLAKIIHNRRLYFLSEFASHYSDNFRPDFLFLSGDINPRLSIRSVGVFFPLEILFFFPGLYFLIRAEKRIAFMLIFWWLAGVIPAALARETPHALRTFSSFPAPVLITAMGVVEVFRAMVRRNWPKIGFGVIFFAYLASLLFYLDDYYKYYPAKYSGAWQYGYKQMVTYVSSIDGYYGAVSVTNRLGRPYIYFLYYKQYSPEQYWNFRRASKDTFGFWSVSGFDKYYFADQILPKGRILYVQPPGESPAGSRLLKTILDLNSQPVFDIYESI